MPDAVLDSHPDAPRAEGGGGHCACHTNWDCGQRSHAKPGPVLVVLSEAEQEMIAKQVAKDAAKLTTQLNAVRRSGFPSSKAVNELLTVNGLIEFGRPTETMLYNHYHLTDRALHFLKTGSMDIDDVQLAAAA
jgi:hypothetical protein